MTPTLREMAREARSRVEAAWRTVPDEHVVPGLESRLRADLVQVFGLSPVETEEVLAQAEGSRESRRDFLFSLAGLCAWLRANDATDFFAHAGGAL
jgi:hypothetical protein